MHACSNLAEEQENVSQGFRIMTVSRDTFYRVKEAEDSGGLEALVNKDECAVEGVRETPDRGAAVGAGGAG